VPFPTHGRPAAELLDELQRRKAGDVPWAEGRVFAYVYDPGPEALRLVTEAFAGYLSENVLDPTSFPSLLELEREVIGAALELMHGDADACGSFTTGGTESILLSVKTARDHWRATRGREAAPELVLAETAHPAFFKACAYFDVTPVRTPVDPLTLRADPDAFERAIGPRTMMLVASAPSYAHGVVDPVPEIAALAARRSLLCHVDCCVGGMYLPFAKRLGVDVPPFDFSLPGVTQLSMDFHKWGYAAKGASAILYRSSELRRHQIFAWSGWTGYTVINPTVLSTKSGGPLAACWAILHHLGMAGYLGLVDRAQRASERIRDGIAAIPGLRVLGRPPANLFALTADGCDPFTIAEEMKARRWFVQPQLGFGPSPANVHLSVGASNAPHVDEFLRDLADATDAARRVFRPEARRELEPLLPPPDAPPGAVLDALGTAFDSDGTQLPARMDAVNRLLDCLPAEQRDRLFVEFTNRLYAPR
jgi:glutamate/tyrosine decarboxylase-like PLP-dependent enzyme